jgi:hypothetical protein
MGKDQGDTRQLVVARGDTTRAEAVQVPLPTTHFRRRAWLAFQRALDPLAPPKPLPMKRARPKSG